MKQENVAIQKCLISVHPEQLPEKYSEATVLPHAPPTCCQWSSRHSSSTSFTQRTGNIARVSSTSQAHPPLPVVSHQMRTRTLRHVLQGSDVNYMLRLFFPRARQTDKASLRGIFFPRARQTGKASLRGIPSASLHGTPPRAPRLLFPRRLRLVVGCLAGAPRLSRTLRLEQVSFFPQNGRLSLQLSFGCLLAAVRCPKNGRDDVVFRRQGGSLQVQGVRHGHVGARDLRWQ